MNGWYVFHFSAMPAKGVELRFTLPAGKAVEVYALDATYSLPLEGLFLLKARPLTAVPYGSGDRYHHQPPRGIASLIDARICFERRYFFA